MAKTGENCRGRLKPRNRISRAGRLRSSPKTRSKSLPKTIQKLVKKGCTLRRITNQDAAAGASPRSGKEVSVVYRAGGVWRMDVSTVVKQTLPVTDSVDLLMARVLFGALRTY